MGQLSNAIRDANIQAIRNRARLTDASDETTINAFNDIYQLLRDIIENNDENLTFTKRLAKNISLILPQLILATGNSNADNYSNEDKTNINNAIIEINNIIKYLAEHEQFDKDMPLETNELSDLNQIFERLIASINTISTTSSKHGSKNANSPNSSNYVANSLSVPQEDLKKLKKDIVGRLKLSESEQDPEKVSLFLKVIQDQIGDTKHLSDEFKDSLKGIFNLSINSNYDNFAAAIEEINDAAITARESIDILQARFHTDSIATTPEEAEGTINSLQNAQQAFEELMASSAKATAHMAGTSLGEITSFYMKLFRSGNDFKTVANNLRYKLRNSEMSEQTRAQLESEIKKFEQAIEEATTGINEQLTHSFLSRIDKISEAIDKGEETLLNKMANGQGLSRKYSSNISNLGSASTKLYQNIVGKELFDSKSILGFNFSGIQKLSPLKRELSQINQIQFELGSHSQQFIQQFDNAAKFRQAGRIAESETAMKAAEGTFASIVNMQANLSANAKKVVQKWNSLSKSEKEKLDPDGSIDREVKAIATSTTEANLDVLRIKKIFKPNTDKTTDNQLKQLENDTKDLKLVENETKKAEEKSKSAMENIFGFISSAYNNIRSIISQTGSLLDRFGGLGMALTGPLQTAIKTYEYHRQQGQARYAGMATDAFIGYTDLDDSAARTQARLMAGNELYVQSGGRIERDAWDKQYQSILRNIGGHYGGTPEEAVKDAEELTKATVLLKNVYGVDEGTITQALKTYYKDIDLSSEDTADAIAKLTTQAQAANIPLGQYLSKVNNLAQTFMKIGIDGEQASVVLNNLINRGIRADIAEELASQTASAMGNFAQDKNKVAFSALMQGNNPWAAIAGASYTHTADGKVRKGWANEIAGYMDTYLNTFMPIYGNNPAWRRMGATDTFKQMGFNQMQASMLASAYLQYGNTEPFTNMLTEMQEQLSNPNAKMEKLNQQIIDQLKKMANQLSEGDRQKALLDSNLYAKASDIGTGIDNILHELAPVILEFQKQMLKFTMEALKWIQKFVTSDLFKTITNTIIEAIRNIPEYLSTIDEKINSAFNAVQSFIEGNTTGGTIDNSESDARSHMPWSDTVTMPAQVAAGMTFMATPGSLPVKAGASVLASQLVDRAAYFFLDLGAKRDEQGRIVKDQYGNPVYEDGLYGQAMKWLSSPDRMWNGEHSTAGTAATMLGTYAFVKSGMGPLELRLEGSIGKTFFKNAARLGGKGAIASIIAGLGYEILSGNIFKDLSDISQSVPEKAKQIEQQYLPDNVPESLPTIARDTGVLGVSQYLVSKFAAPTSPVRSVRGRAAIGAAAIFAAHTLIDYFMSNESATSDTEKTSFFDSFFSSKSTKNEAAEQSVSYRTKQENNESRSTISKDSNQIVSAIRTNANTTNERSETSVSQDRVNIASNILGTHNFSISDLLFSHAAAAELPEEYRDNSFTTDTHTINETQTKSSKSDSVLASLGLLSGTGLLTIAGIKKIDSLFTTLNNERTNIQHLQSDNSRLLEQTLKNDENLGKQFKENAKQLRRVTEEIQRQRQRINAVTESINTNNEELQKQNKFRKIYTDKIQKLLSRFASGTESIFKNTANNIKTIFSSFNENISNSLINRASSSRNIISNAPIEQIRTGQTQNFTPANRNIPIRTDLAVSTRNQSINRIFTESLETINKTLNTRGITENNIIRPVINQFEPSQRLPFTFNRASIVEPVIPIESANITYRPSAQNVPALPRTNDLVRQSTVNEFTKNISDTLIRNSAVEETANRTVVNNENTFINRLLNQTRNFFNNQASKFTPQQLPLNTEPAFISSEEISKTTNQSLTQNIFKRIYDKIPRINTESYFNNNLINRLIGKTPPVNIHSNLNQATASQSYLQQTSNVINTLLQPVKNTFTKLTNTILPDSFRSEIYRVEELPTPEKNVSQLIARSEISNSSLRQALHKVSNAIVSLKDTTKHIISDKNAIQEELSRRTVIERSIGPGKIINQAETPVSQTGPKTGSLRQPITSHNVSEILESNRSYNYQTERVPSSRITELNTNRFTSVIGSDRQLISRTLSTESALNTREFNTNAHNSELTRFNTENYINRTRNTYNNAVRQITANSSIAQQNNIPAQELSRITPRVVSPIIEDLPSSVRNIIHLTEQQSLSAENKLYQNNVFENNNVQTTEPIKVISRLNTESNMPRAGSIHTVNSPQSELLTRPLSIQNLFSTNNTVIQDNLTHLMQTPSEPNVPLQNRPETNRQNIVQEQISEHERIVKEQRQVIEQNLHEQKGNLQHIIESNKTIKLSSSNLTSDITQLTNKYLSRYNSQNIAFNALFEPIQSPVLRQSLSNLATNFNTSNTFNATSINRSLVSAVADTRINNSYFRNLSNTNNVIPTFNEFITTNRLTVPLNTASTPVPRLNLNPRTLSIAPPSVLPAAQSVSLNSSFTQNILPINTNNAISQIASSTNVSNAEMVNNAIRQNETVAERIAEGSTEQVIKTAEKSKESFIQQIKRLILPKFMQTNVSKIVGSPNITVESTPHISKIEPVKITEPVQERLVLENITPEKTILRSPASENLTLEESIPEKAALRESTPEKLISEERTLQRNITTNSITRITNSLNNFYNNTLANSLSQISNRLSPKNILNTMSQFVSNKTSTLTNMIHSTSLEQIPEQVSEQRLTKVDIHESVNTNRSPVTRFINRLTDIIMPLEEPSKELERSKINVPESVNTNQSVISRFMNKLTDIIMPLEPPEKVETDINKTVNKSSFTRFMNRLTDIIMPLESPEKLQETHSDIRTAAESNKPITNRSINESPEQINSELRRMASSNTTNITESVVQEPPKGHPIQEAAPTKSIRLPSNLDPNAPLFTNEFDPVSREIGSKQIVPPASNSVEIIRTNSIIPENAGSAIDSALTNAAEGKPLNTPPIETAAGGLVLKDKVSVFDRLGYMARATGNKFVNFGSLLGTGIQLRFKNIGIWQEAIVDKFKENFFTIRKDIKNLNINKEILEQYTKSLVQADKLLESDKLSPEMRKNIESGREHIRERIEKINSEIIHINERLHPQESIRQQISHKATAGKIALRDTVLREKFEATREFKTWHQLQTEFIKPDTTSALLQKPPERIQELIKEAEQQIVKDKAIVESKIVLPESKTKSQERITYWEKQIQEYKKIITEMESSYKIANQYESNLASDREFIKSTIEERFERFSKSGLHTVTPEEINITSNLKNIYAKKRSLVEEINKNLTEMHNIRQNQIAGKTTYNVEEQLTKLANNVKTKQTELDKLIKISETTKSELSGKLKASTREINSNATSKLNKIRNLFSRMGKGLLTNLSKGLSSLGKTILGTSFESTKSLLQGIFEGFRGTVASIWERARPLFKALSAFGEALSSVAHKIGIISPKSTAPGTKASGTAAEEGAANKGGLWNRFKGWLGESELGKLGYGALRNLGAIINTVIIGKDTYANYQRGDSYLVAFWHALKDDAIPLLTGYATAMATIAAVTIATGGIGFIPSIALGIGTGYLGTKGGEVINDWVMDALGQGATREEREKTYEENRVRTLMAREGLSQEVATKVARGEIDADEAKGIDRQLTEQRQLQIEQERANALAQGLNIDEYNKQLEELEKQQQEALALYEKYNPYQAGMEQYEQADTQEDRDAILHNMLINETQRLSDDYKTIDAAIDNSSLSAEEKTKAKEKLKHDYEEQQKLIAGITPDSDNEEIIKILEQADKQQQNSVEQLQKMTGIDLEQVLGKDIETRDEADQSRRNAANSLVDKITKQQIEEQRLQKITIQTIEDFMQLHEKLMAMLQKSITAEHENLFKMINVTHHILMDIKEVIARSGGVMFGAIMSMANGGGGNVQFQRQQVGDIVTTPEIATKIESAAKKYNIDPNLLKALAMQESGWNQADVSPVGAIGIMQLMPGTAESLGVDPRNLDQNIEGGAKYLREMLDLFNGNEYLALTAYNAGPRDVKKYNGPIPGNAESQNYANSVLSYREKYAGLPSQSGTVVSNRDNFYAVKGYNTTFENRSGGATLPLYAQVDNWDCTPTSVAMMATAYGHPMTQAQGVANWTGGISTSLTNAGVAHDEVALTRESWQLALQKLQNNSPVMLYYDQAAKNSINRGGGSHGVVLGKINSDGTIRVHDPNEGIVHNISQEELTNNFGSNMWLYIPHDTTNVTNFAGGAGNTPGGFNMPGFSGFSGQNFAQYAQQGYTYIMGATALDLDQMYAQLGFSTTGQDAMMRRVGDANAAFDISQNSPYKELQDQRAEQNKADVDKDKDKNKGKNEGENNSEAAPVSPDDALKSALEGDFINKVREMSGVTYNYEWKHDYTGEIDTSDYEKRKLAEELDPEIEKWTYFYKKYERREIPKPEELSEEELKKLSPAERREYHRKRNQLIPDEEQITDKEARDMAVAKVRQRRIDSIDDSRILEIYGMHADDKETEKELAKIIRAGKTDLAGNDLNEQIEKFKKEHPEIARLNELYNAGEGDATNIWSDEQIKAAVYYLSRNDQKVKFKTHEGSSIDNLPHIYLKELTEMEILHPHFGIDWKEESRDIQRPNILRRRNKTKNATIKVRGYERGRLLEFYTDREGAEAFYAEQMELFNKKNLPYNLNANYKKLKDRRLRELGYLNDKGEFIEDGKVVEQLSQMANNQVDADVYCQMATFAEYNMPQQEYLKLLGIHADPSVDPNNYYSAMMNLTSGLSPDGTDWFKELQEEENRILEILNSKDEKDSAEKRAIQKQLDALNTAQLNLGLDIKDQRNQIALIAKSRLIQKDPKKYGLPTSNPRHRSFTGVRGGTILDKDGKVLREGTASFGWDDYDMRFGRYGGDGKDHQSYLAQHPNAQIYLGFQHSNPFYGVMNKDTYGGLSGYQLYDSVANVVDENGNVTNMVHADLNSWEDQIQRVRAMASIASGGTETSYNYRGAFNNGIAKQLDQSITGETIRGQQLAQADLNARRGWGIAKDMYEHGQLTVEKEDSMLDDTNIDSDTRKSKLRIKGDFSGLSEEAIQQVIEALKRWKATKEDATIDLSEILAQGEGAE